MSAQPQDNPQTLALTLEQRIDAVRKGFERLCKAGEIPALGPLLQEFSQAEQGLLLRELIRLEIHFRRLRGEQPTVEEFLRRFPGQEGLLVFLRDTAIGLVDAGIGTTGPNRSASTQVGPDRLPEGVGNYTILAELGRGGMGIIYKARQASLNRLVALKMILHPGAAGAADLARFRMEAEAIARLQHPNIVQVHEVGEHEGKPFFSLEFCSGGTLRQKLKGTPLPAREAAGLVAILARAMQAAHARNVIHRDLKPANVLLTEDGTPKIGDFGLAKKLDDQGQTVSGAIMGTPSYMAPEQATGKSKNLGPACDIYALGAILYECLTGRPPFKAATVMDTLHQVANDEPVAPSQLQQKIPRDLETICLKCLRKEPGKRYALGTLAQ